jgi:hypothetical protein
MESGQSSGESQKARGFIQLMNAETSASFAQPAPNSLNQMQFCTAAKPFLPHHNGIQGRSSAPCHFYVASLREIGFWRLEKPDDAIRKFICDNDLPCGCAKATLVPR